MLRQSDSPYNPQVFLCQAQTQEGKLMPQSSDKNLVQGNSSRRIWKPSEVHTTFENELQDAY